ncbi:MAG: SUMF1/EgtB/PvdO family nonheme iron enzyme [Acidobacteriota bacterium]
MRDLGPDKKVGLCAFGLKGADAGKNEMVFWLGLMGRAINSSRADSPYSQQLSEEVVAIFRSILGESGAFQIPAPESLRESKDKESATLAADAGENDLYACMEIEARLGVAVGFKKRVKMETRWRIVSPSGLETEVWTEVASEDAQSMFPDTADPKLKPVFLQLARASAVQYLEELSGMMREAGSTASVKISDPDAVAAGALSDTGKLPQPEADCAINSDGKWEKKIGLSDTAAIEMVYIPNGSFMMGSADELDDESSQPRHKVTIGRAFWMGKYEVTQAQWKAVMGTSPSKFKGDSLPVETVSWETCQKFLAALNQRLGLAGEKALRLPTEAEWEYACRAGTDANYSFSNSERSMGEYAWFEENSSKTTHPIGQRRPNPWGLYDIYGNVSEWCEDAWHDDYKNAPADGSAWTGGDDDYRMLRGAYWDQSAYYMRSYCRDTEVAEDGGKTIGFRLVTAAPNTEQPAATAPSTPVESEVATPALSSEKPAAQTTPAGQPKIQASGTPGGPEAASRPESSSSSTAPSYYLSRLDFIIPSSKGMNEFGDNAIEDARTDNLCAAYFWRIFLSLPLDELKRKLDSEQGINLNIEAVSDLLKNRNQKLLITDSAFSGRKYFWQSAQNGGNENIAEISFTIRNVMNGGKSVLEIALRNNRNNKRKTICSYSVECPIGFSLLSSPNLDIMEARLSGICDFVKNVTGSLRQKK